MLTLGLILAAVGLFIGMSALIVGASEEPEDRNWG